jgi:hypothetical protein
MGPGLQGLRNRLQEPCSQDKRITELEACSSIPTEVPVPSTMATSTSWEQERAELKAVLQSPVFARSPALSHLLSYLCEKTFAGETDQIKEYSVALDVFDRQDSFDQDTDSIVRVQANRLRKRLGEYYAKEGASHPIHISVPVGQYVPMFQKVALPEQPILDDGRRTRDVRADDCGLHSRKPPQDTANGFSCIRALTGAFGRIARRRGSPHPCRIHQKIR